MKFIILLPLLVAAVSAEGAPYRFSYEANDDGQHQRNERGDHGSVQGSYSYVDPNGNLRRVNYVADEYGFRPSGDIGVDKETEAAAADLAAQAPQGPTTYEAPGASYQGGGNSGGYGGNSKGNYQAPRPRPQKSYQSPKQSYNQGGSKGGYSQQKQSDFSYNTEINHQAPAKSYQKPRPRPQQRPQSYQQPQYQQQQDDGSYDSSGDDGSSYGPKRTVEYEVRTPTHKITSRIN